MRQDVKINTFAAYFLKKFSGKQRLWVRPGTEDDSLKDWLLKKPHRGLASLGWVYVGVVDGDRELCEWEMVAEQFRCCLSWAKS